MTASRAPVRIERPSVEYNLVEHCNLTCYACDHASPLLARKLADLDGFVRDLGALAPVFHAAEIRLVGGEPLLHPRIVEFQRAARAAGVADRVVVYTNGVLLHRMPVEFWEEIDDLRVSVYPGVELPLGLEALSVICAGRGIRFEADAKFHSFQRTLLNRRIEDPELVSAVFRRCEMPRSLSCHTVHEGRFHLCSIAPFQRPRLAQLGIAFDEGGEDSVALHGNPRLREELALLLVPATTSAASGGKPLAACAYCLGTAAPWTPHRQLDRTGLDAWRAEDHAPLIAETRGRLLAENA